MLWGLPFSTWELIVKASLWVAGISGAVAAATAFIAGYVGYELTDAVQKEADIKIAEAHRETRRLELLLNDEIRKNAWRRIQSPQHDAIAAAVKRDPPIRVTVAFPGDDPEASLFASDIIKSLEDGGATVNPQPSAVFVGNMPVVGLVLQPEANFDASKIEQAIATAAPINRNESLKSFPAQTRADLYLYIGNRPRPF